MPVDPALTALWAQDRNSGLHGPALPDMDCRNRASSNFSSNIVSESGSTNFVEDLVGLQAEAAADDLLHDLGGAAEDGLDATERGLTWCFRRSSRAPSDQRRPWCSRGAIWAAITRHGIVSPCRNSPSRGVSPTTTPNQRPRISQPSMRMSTPVFIAAQLPQILAMHDAGDGSHAGSRPPRAAARVWSFACRRQPAPASTCSSAWRHPATLCNRLILKQIHSEAVPAAAREITVRWRRSCPSPRPQQ